MHNFSEFWREVGDFMSLFLYLSMYFPRTKAYSYTNNFSTVAKIQKFNIAARLLCNSQSVFKLHQLPQQCTLQRFPPPPPFTPGSGASLGSLSSQALYRRLWFHFDILLKAVWKLFFFFLNVNLWKTVKTAHLPRMTIWYLWGEQNKCAADSEANSHEAITNVLSNGSICSKCRHPVRWLGRKFPQREEWLLGHLLINLPHDLIVKLHTILEFQLPENKAYTIDTFSLAHLLKVLDCWTAEPQVLLPKRAIYTCHGINR